ncbi:MAG: hypothetical protein ACRDF7_10470, partial [Candidatus Limnocylindrales bacterium]
MIETAPPSGWSDDFQFDQVEGAEPPQRGRRRWLWVAVPVVVLVLAGAWIWIANPFGTSAARLVTATSTTGTVVSSVSVSGSVASSAIKELFFATSGSVTAVNVIP